MATRTNGEIVRWRERRSDFLVDLFYPIADRLFDEDDVFLMNLERKLEQARMNQTVELYLSRGTAYGAICGFLLWILGLVVGIAIFTTGLIQVAADPSVILTATPRIYAPFSLPSIIPWSMLAAVAATAVTPLLVLTSGIVFGAIGFGAAFGAFITRPYLRASNQRREINMVLPDAVSFMYALSVGGMGQLEIIEAMAEAEDTYGEVSREFRTIVQETRYFDTDYRTAIRTCAGRTPSSELSQFLTDMLSIIDSGGNMSEFLSDKKDFHFRTAKEQQQRNLDTLELFSEMYITLSLFPLLLIIVLVIMNLMGGSPDLLLYLTVYGLIPVLGAAFLVLVATIKWDEVGNGYLSAGEDGRRFDAGRESSPFDLGYIKEFAGKYYIFDRIKSREGAVRFREFIQRPDIFFRDNPYYTLGVTVPVSVALVLITVAAGAAPLSWDGVLSQPVWATFVYLYLPLFLVAGPLAIFWELNVRNRRAVLSDLSANLRKLASANATGLTLLESIKVVADTTPGRLGEEFGVMYAKSKYGMHLSESIIVFNNKYHIPRLARTVTLISKAHEISGEISSVLSTAARASEAQEDLERERISHALIHVAIIILTFLVLLGVMVVMKAQFVDVIGELVDDTGGSGEIADGFGGSVNVQQLELLFFHAVTLQAILSGLVCGYIRHSRLTSGVKYVVGLAAVTLLVWVIFA